MAEETFGPIDLEDPVENPNAIDLTPQGPQINTDLADARATKYDFGLGKYSPSKDTLRFALVNGQEDAARTNAVAQENVRARQLREGLARQYIMARPPGKATPEDLQQIYTLTDPQAEAVNRNPKIFFEEQYAKQVISDGLKTEAASDLIKNTPPDQADKITKFAEKVITHKEIAQKVYEETKLKYEDQNWGAWSADMAMEFIPGYSWYKQMNNLKGAPRTSFLPGNNQLDQMQAFYMMPTAEAEKNLRAAVDGLAADNLVEALEFARTIQSMTTSDVFLKNLFGAIDLTTPLPIPGIGIISVAGYKALGRGAAKTATVSAQALKDAAQSIVKGTGTAAHDPTILAEAAGDIEKSSLSLAAQRLKNAVEETGKVGTSEKLFEGIPALINPVQVTNNGVGSSLSGVRAQRLQDTLSQQADKLIEGIFFKPLTIDRLEQGSAAQQAAFANTWKLWKDQHAKLVDSVLDVGHVVHNPADQLTLQHREFFTKARDNALSTIEKRGLSNEYTDYLIHTGNFDRGLQMLGDLEAQNLRLAHPASAKSSKSISDILKGIDEGAANQAVEADALKAMKASAEKLAGISDAKKKLFSTASDADSRLRKLDAVPAVKKDVRLGKAFGNVDYIAVKLGKDSGLAPVAKSGDALADDLERELLSKYKGYYTDSKDPLEKALSIVTSPGLSGNNESWISSAKWAMANNRPDIAQALAERARRSADKFSTTPGVPKGHANYVAIEKDLTSIKAEKEALAVTLDKIAGKSSALSGALSETAIKLGRNETLNNAKTSASIKLGHPHEAVLFESKENAEMWAKDIMNLKSGWTVGQKGTGWYIEVLKPLDEFESSVRNALTAETNGKTPGSMSKIIGMLRSPEYTQAANVMQDRHVTAFGTSALRELQADVSKNISNLPRAYSMRAGLANLTGWRKGSREDFVSFLETQRDAKDTVTNTVGRFSTSQAGFEKEWFDKHKRLPTYQESFAYWSYVQLSNTEFVAKTLGIYRDKAIKGWEMHDFGAVNGFKAKKEEFEGKFLPGIPEMREDFGVLVMNPVGNNIEYMRNFGGAIIKSTGPIRKLRKESDPTDFFKKEYTKDLTKRGEQTDLRIAPTREVQRELFNDLTTSGYKTVKLTQFSEKKLREGLKQAGVEVPEGGIDFVMTRELSSAPLDIQQIPNRPGGHHQYLAEYYLRQPVLKTYNGITTYYEDRNIAGFTDSTKGKLFEERFNTAREMYYNQVRNIGEVSDDALGEYIKKNLPYSLNGFKRLFDAEQGGNLDLTTKFYLTEANKSVDAEHGLAHLYPENRFKKYSDSDLNMYKDGINLKYTGERGDTLQNIAVEGTKENPVFKFEEAKKLSPLKTLDEAMAETMRGRYIEDFKFKMGERFIAEFGDMLKVTPQQLRQNPMRWLYEAPFKDAGLDRDKLNAAITFRRTTLEFLNMKSSIQKDFDFFKKYQADGIFAPTGSEVTGTEPWLQYRISLPQKIKNAVFDAKMAWNPAQMWLQAQQIAAVAGIEGPARASKAGGAALTARFMRLYGDDPETLGKMSQSLLKTEQWNPEHFKEAHEALVRSGFGTVGHEVADMGDFMAPNIINGTGIRLGEGYNSFMNIGRGFFKIGERFSRDTSWFAAYDRWRAANPTANLTDTDIKAILDRASLLNGDMSKASAASFQQGVAGVPTQFWGFQVRLFEQLTDGLRHGGGRLTNSEKFGILATNSVLYGIPIGLGTAMIGFPAADMLKQAMLEKGYDAENSIFTRVGMSGMVNEVFRMFTGENTNFGTRYGPGNTTMIKDLLPNWLGGSEKSAFDLMMGVSGSTMRNLMFSLEPFTFGMLTSFKDDQKSYPLKWEDFEGVLSNVTGYDKIGRSLLAMNTGQYMSKNGEVIDKMSKTEALQKLIFDIEPERISDVRNIKEIFKARAELQRKQLPEVKENFKKAMAAYKNGDDETGHQYFTRMKAHIIAGGWREDQKFQLFKEVSRGYETQVESLNRRLAMSSRPALEAYIKRLERRQ